MPATEYDLLLKIQHLFLLVDVYSQARLTLARDDVRDGALRGQWVAKVGWLQLFSFGASVTYVGVSGG